MRYIYLRAVCTPREARAAIILHKLGLCIHPAKAITPFHFSVKNEDGTYSDKLQCGFICEVCLGKVEMRMCDYRYIGECSHG